MIFFVFLHEKSVNTLFFVYQHDVTNTVDLRTWFYVKNKQKSVKNETCCMLQIKKIFLKENIFSGLTHSPESKFDIKRIKILKKNHSFKGLLDWQFSESDLTDT